MPLKDIPGQPRTRRFIRQLLRSGNIPHALLFTGMAGVGKKEVAFEFAKAVNCLDPRDLDSCGECPSCRKMDAGSHPDILHVQSEGASIKVDRIRSLRERLRFSPFEGKWRVIVIQDAHNLRAESGNALLKLLEEPPARNLFILTAIEPQMLLPTIVSRCCHIRFQPLEDGWIESRLVEAYSLSPSRAKEIAGLAMGSMERAKHLVEDDCVARRDEVIRAVTALYDMAMMDFFPFLAEWAKKSEDLEQDLECIKLWVRDLIYSRLMTDFQPLSRPDAALCGAVRDVAVERLFQLYEHVERAMQHLRQNANKLLTLESVCLAIKGGIYGQGCWNSIPQRG